MFLELISPKLQVPIFSKIYKDKMYEIFKDSDDIEDANG